MSNYKQHVEEATLHTKLRKRSSEPAILFLLTNTYSLKNLIPVKFSFHTKTTPAQSTESTPVEGSSSEKQEEQRDPMCPSCKKQLNNNVIMFGVYPALSHISYH